jgi:hypothetical protein
MCNDYKLINALIEEKKHNPFKGVCESTYINDGIYAEFAKRKDLKWIRVQDLRLLYHWSEEKTQMMYDKTVKVDGWTDGHGIYRLYDFGKGANKIVKEDGVDKLFHEAQHDHIISRDEARRLGWTEEQINHPSNIQWASAIQNFMKRNFTKEMWLAVSPTIPNLYPR